MLQEVQICGIYHGNNSVVPYTHHVNTHLRHPFWFQKKELLGVFRKPLVMVVAYSTIINPNLPDPVNFVSFWNDEIFTF